MDILSESVGISPARAAPRGSAARPRTNSASSENYGNLFVPENLGEQFSNARTPAARKPALNSEERSFVEKTLKKQNIDPSHLSPINQDILRGRFSSSSPRPAVIISQNPQTSRLSGIQQHDGVSTRSIRAETGEPHTQLQTPARGRPRTRPFGPQTQPNQRGRPTNAELQARTQEALLPHTQTQTPRLRLPKKK